LRLTDRKLLATFFLALTIMMGGYFLGAVGGQLYQRWHDASAAHGDTHTAHAEHDETDAAARFAATGAGAEGLDAPHTGPASPYPQPIGVFFSIYYCMTGLHAFHVIGGMVALSWLYMRCLKAHFRPDYFGPVDFVGLYWHLVDLIWIYLFPLLYLIN
jgi:cytochrome c oxidase subunit 3